MRAIAAGLITAALTMSCGGAPATTPVGETGGGGGGGGGGSGPVVTTSVNIQSSTFNPAAIRVSPGATVTWTNSDGVNHNVTFASPAVPDIGSWTSGTRSTAMPSAAATYSYECTLHPGMNGSVQVQ